MGFLAAQIVHAAGESALSPIPPHTHAIVLAVPDEPTLAAVEVRLRAAGLAVTAIREPDAPWNGALTVLAIAPGPRSILRKHLSSIPLFRGPVAQMQSASGKPGEVAASQAARPTILVRE